MKPGFGASKKKQPQNPINNKKKHPTNELVVCFGAGVCELFVKRRRDPCDTDKEYIVLSRSCSHAGLIIHGREWLFPPRQNPSPLGTLCSTQPDSAVHFDVKQSAWSHSPRYGHVIFALTKIDCALLVKEAHQTHLNIQRGGWERRVLKKTPKKPFQLWITSYSEKSVYTLKQKLIRIT